MQFQIFTFLCVKSQTTFWRVQRNAASTEVNQAFESCDVCPLPHNELHRFSSETPDLMNFHTYGPRWQFDKDLLLNTWWGSGKSCHEINQKIHTDVLQATNNHHIQGWAFFPFFFGWPHFAVSHHKPALSEKQVRLFETLLFYPLINRLINYIWNAVFTKIHFDKMDS